MGWSKNTESETHVVFLRLTFSDAGSTPAASTNYLTFIASRENRRLATRLNSKAAARLSDSDD